MIAGLLVVIIAPLSFGYVQYYQIALEKGRVTGVVYIDQVYEHGRHVTGPAKRFQHYNADGNIAVYMNVSLASADKLETDVDMTFIYFIVPDQLPLLQRDFNINYQKVVEFRILSAIKDAAVTFQTDQFFNDRALIEAAFLEAAQSVGNSSYVIVPYFFLNAVRVPAVVSGKQLETAIQDQINQQQLYQNTAAEIRQHTLTLVNQLINNATIIVSTSLAEAASIVSQAASNATRIVEVARAQALHTLSSQLNVTDALTMQQLDYVISMLQTTSSGDLNLHVGYDTKLLTA